MHGELTTAAINPCAAHPCDGCKICRKGRCCRRDQPGYKAPQLGEWDGPIWGPLGILEDDGERARCHCCGDYYGHVAVHVISAHELTPDEYRAIFGLKITTGLIGPRMRRLQSAHGKQRAAKGELQGYIDKALTMLTPEQRSAYRRGQKMRLEYRLKPLDPERYRKSSETLRRRFASGELKRKGGWQKGPNPLVAKGQARLRELRLDPEWRAAWLNNMSRVRKKEPDRLTCAHCGQIFFAPSYQHRKACSWECGIEIRKGPRTPKTTVIGPA